jgi:hypothetical protein
MLLQSVPTVENLKADVTGNATLQVLSLYVFPQIIGVFDSVIALRTLPHFETHFISHRYHFLHCLRLNGWSTPQGSWYVYDEP